VNGVANEERGHSFFAFLNPPMHFPFASLGKLFRIQSYAPTHFHSHLSLHPVLGVSLIPSCLKVDTPIRIYHTIGRTNIFKEITLHTTSK
jgi:hypothetical protein